MTFLNCERDFRLLLVAVVRLAARLREEALLPFLTVLYELQPLLRVLRRLLVAVLRMLELLREHRVLLLVLGDLVFQRGNRPGLRGNQAVYNVPGRLEI